MDLLVHNIDDLSARDVEYVIAIIGAVTASLFCFLLAYMIRDAARPKPADKWLALTMFGFGMVAGMGAYRITVHDFRLPVITSVLWVVIIISAIGSTYNLQKERRTRETIRSSDF